MASIDEVVDAIKTAIPTYTGFSTKTEMYNAYNVDDNPSNVIEDSWGLVIGSGSRVDHGDEFLLNEVTTNRDIGVVLCRAVYDLHGEGQAVSEQSEQLLLDAAIIRDNFLSSSKFGVLKGGEKIDYSGDSGVNFQGDDKERFIYTQIAFTFEIIEQIN